MLLSKHDVPQSKEEEEIKAEPCPKPEVPELPNFTSPNYLMWCATKVPARKHPPFVPKNQFTYPGVLESLNYVNFLNLSFLGHITRKIRLFVLFSPFCNYGSTGTFVRMEGVLVPFSLRRGTLSYCWFATKGVRIPPFVPLS